MKTLLLLCYILIPSLLFAQEQGQDLKKLTNGFPQESLVLLPTSSSDVAFEVKQTKGALPASLQEKYPEIHSYEGISADGTLNAVFTITPSKVFGHIIEADGIVRFDADFTDTLYEFHTEKETFKSIDNYCDHADHQYEDHLPPSAEAWNMRIADSAEEDVEESATPSGSSGEKLITFIVAVSYSGAEAERAGVTTKAEAMAVINSNITAINKAFRNELQIQFVVHPNNDQIIFFDSSTDPFGLGGTNTMLGTHNDFLKTALGEDTYDLGILLHPGEGLGWAGGRLCAGSKGRCATTNNVGLHRHEVGHMLSGAHMYSRDASNGISALGKTMVGANWSVVHPYNYDRMRDVILTQHANTGCGVETATGNTPPVLTLDIPETIAIPANTPYVLSGHATDIDGDTLTYSWYHMQAGEDDTNNLLFAHERPSETGNVRYVPSLSSLQDNIKDPYSKLATVNRKIIARLVVRDNQKPVGSYVYKEIQMTTDSSAGPFVVTYPNQKELFSGNSDITVTWDVANTDNTIINASKVDILLSTDGGTTFSTLLANTPNDGSQAVTLPNTPSDSCRIKVQATGNVFYDFSDEHFEIIDQSISEFRFLMADSVQSVYTETSCSFPFGMYYLGGYNKTIDASITGLPSGVSHTFPAQFTGEVKGDLTLSGIGSLALGRYPFTIQLQEQGSAEIHEYQLVLVKRDVGQGITGGALNLQEYDAHMTADWTGLNTAEFTVSAWIKPDQTTTRAGIINLDNNFVLLIDNGQLRYAHPSTNSQNWKTVDGGMVKEGEWNHVAVVVRQAYEELYVNGQYARSQYSDQNPLTPLKGTLELGTFKDKWYWKYTGLIDEVRIYNEARSAEQIWQEIHQTSTADEPSLIVYYQFNEPQGEQPLDVRSRFRGNLIDGAFVETSSSIPTASTTYISQPQSDQLMDFGPANVTMELNAFDDSRTVAVHKFDISPNTMEGISPTANTFQEYWEINDYPDEPILDIKKLGFKLSTDITTEQANKFVNYNLYHRGQTSDSIWTKIGTASSADATNDLVAFDNVSHTGQFIIVEETAPVLGYVLIKDDFDCLPVQNQLTGSTLQYELAGSNLTGDLTVTHSNPLFSFSLTENGTYEQQLTISPQSEVVTRKTLFIRLNSPDSGELQDTITLSSAGADTVQIFLKAEVLREASCNANAFEFDGSGQKINIEDLDFAPTAFTVEFWLKPYSYGNYNQMIGNKWGEFLFHLDDDGAIAVGVDVATRFYTPDNFVTLNQWMHVAYTFDNGTANLYFDGQLYDTKTGVTMPETWNSNFTIGTSSTSNAMDGQMDEFRIWRKARTQAEIQKYMGEIYPLNNACSDSLMVYYQFEEMTNGYVENIADPKFQGRLNTTVNVIPSTVSVICDSNQNPTVSITTDKTDYTIGDEVTIQWTANDPDGTIASIDVTVNGTTIATSGNSAIWTSDTTGSIVIAITVTDDKGATATNQTTINILPNQDPMVAISTDKTDYSFGENVAINWTASDSDGAITSIEIQVDGTTIATSGSATSWTPIKTGTIIVSITATDDKGATASQQSSITVTEDATSLNADQSDNGTISFSVTGTDPSNIFSIQYFIKNADGDIIDSKRVFSPNDLNYDWFINHTGNVSVEAVITFNNFNTSNTDALSMAVQRPLGIGDELLTTLDFSLFPNPASEQLHIQYTLDRNAEVAIEVFSMDGIKVNTLNKGSQSIGSHTLDANIMDLKKGIYFIQIRVNEGFAVRKLVVE